MRGNYMAENWERRHLSGKTCDLCGGERWLYPSDETDVEKICAFEGATDEVIEAYKSDFRKNERIECPRCLGEGRIYE